MCESVWVFISSWFAPGICVRVCMYVSESLRVSVSSLSGCARYTCVRVYVCMCESVSVSLSIGVSLSLCLSVSILIVWASISSEFLSLLCLRQVCEYVCVCTCERVSLSLCLSVSLSLSLCVWVSNLFSFYAMGWLRLVGSLKLYVSFAEYRLFYRAPLQKRPIILRSLLIEATP